MKQLFTISLLSFFLFDAVGYYFLYQNNINADRKEAYSLVHSKACSDKWITISVSKKQSHQITWLTKDEFQYQNEMYDVVTAKDLGDRIEYTCYHDQREEAIVRNFARQVKHKSATTGRNRSRNLLKEFNNYFSEEATSYHTFSPVSILLKPGSDIRSSLYELSVLTPPPQCI